MPPQAESKRKVARQPTSVGDHCELDVEEGSLLRAVFQDTPEMPTIPTFLRIRCHSLPIRYHA